MLLEDKPDPGMHALQHPPVLLDETRSQNIVPRDDLVNRMLEYMLVDHSLEPQHSRQVERGWTRIDFVRQPECVLLGGGRSWLVPDQRVKQGIVPFPGSTQSVSSSSQVGAMRWKSEKLHRAGTRTD